MRMRPICKRLLVDSLKSFKENRRNPVRFFPNYPLSKGEQYVIIKKMLFSIKESRNAARKYCAYKE
jgi:hypothetical protein